MGYIVLVLLAVVLAGFVRSRRREIAEEENHAAE